MLNSQKSSSLNKDYIANAFSQYLKHWKIFAAIIFSLLALTVIYVKIKPKVYSINASVIIKKEDQKASSMMASAMMKNFGVGMNGLVADGSTDDEIQIFYSQNIIRKTLSALGMYATYDLVRFPINKSLYKNSPLVLETVPGFVDTLTTDFTFLVNVKQKGIKVEVKAGKNYKETFEYKNFPADIKTKLGTFRLKEDDKVKMNRPYSLKIGLNGLDPMAERIKNEVLTVETLTKKSDVIGLIYEDESRQRGKDFLNEIIRQYNIDALSDKNKTALSTTHFLKIRIDSLYGELRSIESNIEVYKETHKFIDAETEISLTLKKISQLQGKDSKLNVQLAMINGIESQIKTRGEKYELLPSSIGLPESVVSAVDGYNEAILYRMRILRNSTKDNPAIQTIDEQLKSLNKNLLVSLQNAKRDIDISKADSKETQSQINDRVDQMPRMEKEYVDLKRQQELKSQIYLFLLQKMEETQLTLASTEPKAKVVDEAYCLVQPVAPKKFIILFAALIVGFFISAVVVCIKVLKNKKIVSLQDLQTLSDSNVLAYFPQNSDVSFPLKNLRADILQEMQSDSDNKVIVVSSIEKGQGKTLLSKQLTESISKTGCKVIVVDFNIANPTLSCQMKLTTSKGVSDYLLQEAAEEEIIQPTSIPNLDMIPAGMQQRASEMLYGKRIDKLFKSLKKNYDVVLVDTASFNEIPDSLLLMRLSDLNLFVVEIGNSSKEAVEKLNTLLANERVKNVNLVAFESQKQK